MGTIAIRRSPMQLASHEGGELGEEGVEAPVLAEVRRHYGPHRRRRHEAAPRAARRRLPKRLDLHPACVQYRLDAGGRSGSWLTFASGTDARVFWR